MTADPRLNSLHLEAPRRQDYRRAREALLQARGCHTLCAENRPEPDESGPSDGPDEPGSQESRADED